MLSARIVSQTNVVGVLELSYSDIFRKADSTAAWVVHSEDSI